MHLPFERSQRAEAFVKTLVAFRGDVGIRRIWGLDDTQKADDAPFPSKVFLSTNYGSHYVAPYVDGRLFVWDAKTARLTPATRKTYIFLDSDMLSALRAVMVHNAQDDRLRRIVFDLLQHCDVWRSELQPLPYLRQIALQTTVADTADDAVRAIEAVLRFQGLDVHASLSSESLVEDSTFREKLAKVFGTTSYVDAAIIQFEQIAKKPNPIPGDMVSTYALLLKLVQTGISMRNKSIDEKLALVDDFIRTVIINSQPQLHVLSRFFFSQKLGRLLKATPGDRNFKIKNIVGAAYDLNLATLAQQFLGLSDPPTADLSIVFTGDAALGDYASRFPIRGLMVMEDQSFKIYHAWDDDWIKGQLGDALWKDACEASEKQDVTKTQGPDDPLLIIAKMRTLEESLNISPQDSLLSTEAEKGVAWIKSLDE